MDLRRAETLAGRLLRKYKVMKPPVPIEEITVGEGLKIVRYKLEDNVSGLLIRDDETGTIAVNSSHHLNRQRFTVAHELGHFALHQGLPAVFVDELMVHFRADTTVSNYDPRETEANHFAGCILLPASFLKSDLREQPIDISDDTAVRSMARRYEVSQQALTVRLSKLRLIVA